MTNKKLKVVLSGIFFPLAMLTYFRRALERRDDVDLITVGPYTGDWIPWGGGMRLPTKYVSPPTIPLPQQYAGQCGLGPEFVQVRLPWEPDLWLQVDAGWWMKKPLAKVVVHIATDPHCLNYDKQRGECDIFYGMQTPYLKPGDRYLPYAFDPEIHVPIPLDKKYDACLIGLHYEHRDRLVQTLRNRGRLVYYDLGVVFDEYTLAYNESRVALSWSSMEDTPTRVFEAFGMNLPLVCNRTPDLSNWFVEGEHYLGFGTAEEGANQVEKFLNDPDYAEEVAGNAHRKVIAGHSWDHRISQILEDCKLVW